jgi:hypothetical protein
MLAALTALMFMTTIAAAQAPGATAPPPSGSVLLVPPSAPPPSAVMQRRWAVTLGVGWETLAVKTEPMPRTAMTLLELAGRYRIRRPLELGVSFIAGGAMKGELDTVRLYVDGRWRFLAEQPWNVYARVSLGIAAVANDQANKQERAGRGSLQLGGGVERRWRWFGVSAELRLVGVGENPDAPTPAMVTPASQFARNKVSGGSFAIASTFYF